jgi:hypothetical protein
MKTVLPALESPVTPSRNEGDNNPVARPASVSRAIRASSVKVVRDAKRQASVNSSFRYRQCGQEWKWLVKSRHLLCRLQYATLARRVRLWSIHRGMNFPQEHRKVAQGGHCEVASKVGRGEESFQITLAGGCGADAVVETDHRQPRSGKTADHCAAGLVFAVA